MLKGQVRTTACNEASWKELACNNKAKTLQRRALGGFGTTSGATGRLDALREKKSYSADKVTSRVRKVVVAKMAPSEELMETWTKR